MGDNFKFESYKRSCHINQRLQELYSRLDLPSCNFYALLRAVFTHDVHLCKDKDYLVLLASLWSPIEHLMNTFCLEEYMPPDLNLDEFQTYEPEKFKQFCDGYQAKSEFYCNSCKSSLNLPIRMQSYDKLLQEQRDLLCAYKKWIKSYNRRQPTMRAETAHLTADDDDGRLDRVLLELVLIFEEYVKNLCVESKNRTKYRPVLDRVRRFICGLQEEAENRDSPAADDVVGSIFERLLINATQYKPLSTIGPAYVFWIFKNRLIKIGNPTGKNANLLMNESNAEDCFPFNDTFHYEGPTIADESQIYLFDELCELWSRYNLGDVSLSKFLFERITPFYLEFTKRDNNRAPNEETVTHQYVSYPIAQFSSNFLQRVETHISRTLYISPKEFDLTITNQEWDSIWGVLDKTGKPMKQASVAFKKMIARVEDGIASYLGEKAQIKIDYNEHMKAIYAVADQDKWYKDYVQIFWLGNQGGSLEEGLMRKDFLLRFILRYSHELERGSREDLPTAFVEATIHAIYSKRLYWSYFRDLLIFSKKALSRKYSMEQYNRLHTFCGKPLIESDEVFITPVKFEGDKIIISDKTAKLPISISKTL